MEKREQWKNECQNKSKTIFCSIFWPFTSRCVWVSPFFIIIVGSTHTHTLCTIIKTINSRFIVKHGRSFGRSIGWSIIIIIIGTISNIGDNSKFCFSDHHWNVWPFDVTRVCLDNSPEFFWPTHTYHVKLLYWTTRFFFCFVSYITDVRECVCVCEISPSQTHSSNYLGLVKKIHKQTKLTKEKKKTHVSDI